MALQVLEKRSRLPVSVEQAFRWHERPWAFLRLVPPWERVERIESTGGIRDGGKFVVRVHFGPIPMTWSGEHQRYIENRQFYDVQRRGPFAWWEHTHRFEPDGDNPSFLTDHVEYELPLGVAGRLAAGGSIRRKLERLFDCRHRTLVADLAAHREYSTTSRRVLITGATGLVGSNLVAFLGTGGHSLTVLSRGRAAADPLAPVVKWDPSIEQVDRTQLEGFDAVVHLAGENIAAGRWTEARKAKIRDSRVTGTRFLCETLAGLERKPKVLVSASAIGFYGDRGDEPLDESSAAGKGFLADVCREWEAATRPAEEAGIRVVHARFGVILSPAGGALAKMLTPFKLGGGGVLGDGRQYMSWVGIDDVLQAILHAIATEQVSGAMNVTAPNPVTNREFTRELARAVHRPAIVPMPAAAARLAFGQMADELLLASQRVTPKKLLDTGYEFRDPTLDAALRQVLGA